MRIDPLPPRRAIADERGVSMLEFVLMLPFIWIVLALTLSFGQGFLEKQRSLVGVREFALRSAAAIAGGRVDDAAATVDADTLRVRRMSASHSAGSGRGCRHQSGPADRDGILATLADFLGRISATQVYETTATGQPLAGRLLPRAVYAGCLAIDANPWTKHDIGGSYGGLLRRIPLLGGLEL